MTEFDSGSDETGVLGVAGVMGSVCETRDPKREVLREDIEDDVRSDEDDDEVYIPCAEVGLRRRGDGATCGCAMAG